MPSIIILGIILILEVFLRYGGWDSHIKPSSFLGTALYRDKAIQKFGYDKVNWVTIGDSRMDWGIDHGKLFDDQKEQGLNHLRLSFGSANFIGMQATIDWSIDKLPNLKGIMIGLTEYNFAHNRGMAKQFKVVWPYRNYFKPMKYSYSFGHDLIKKTLSHFALFNYFPDMKNFFMHIGKRLRVKKQYLTKQSQYIFSYKRSSKGDTCNYNVNTLQNCIKAALKINAKKGNKSQSEKTISHLCGNSFATRRLKKNLPYRRINEELMDKTIKNWSMLFKSIIERQKELLVVLLPEHKLLNHSMKYSNAEDVLTKVLSKFSANNHFNVLDVRQIFKNKGDKCRYFKDIVHYNDGGIKLITNSILDYLTPNYQLTHNTEHKQKGDSITKNSFE